MPVYASKYTGRLLFGDEIFWKGDACATCATSQYRAGLTHCLWAGWWAPVALFVNPRMIWRNAMGLRVAHRLAPPTGAGFDEPLDPGRPVLARPAALVGIVAPLAVLGLIVALIVALTGGDGVDRLRAGQCIDLPAGSTVQRLDTVPCSGPHNAEVSGIISGPGVPARQELCAAETARYLGADVQVGGLRPAAIRYGDADEQRVVCIITTEDGSPRSGRFRRPAS